MSVWVVLLAVWIVARDTLRSALSVDDAAVPLFIAGISVLIAFVLVAVVRRWRWVFWLVLLACLGGIIRVPISALELAGIFSTPLPPWYVMLQGAIGAAQIGVAVILIRGYRRAGVWG